MQINEEEKEATVPGQRGLTGVTEVHDGVGVVGVHFRELKVNDPHCDNQQNFRFRHKTRLLALVAFNTFQYYGLYFL